MKVLVWKFWKFERKNYKWISETKTSKWKTNSVALQALLADEGSTSSTRVHNSNNPALPNPKAQTETSSLKADLKNPKIFIHTKATDLLEFGESLELSASNQEIRRFLKKPMQRMKRRRMLKNINSRLQVQSQ